MRRDGSFKLALAIFIAVLFALFQVGSYYFAHRSPSAPFSDPLHPESLFRKSQIIKTSNKDASLSIPFLDKISKYWYVGGETEVRNAAFIRLTKAGTSNQHGIILSNGIGDNVIDNFEIIVKFRLSTQEKNSEKKKSYPLMGDGMAIAITSEKDFLRKDLHSSYARKLYEINSGGVLVDNKDMMGLPRNLPGVAVIIDTYKNHKGTKTAIPFLDAILNTSPKTQWYDLASDGRETTALKLNQNHIRLKQSIVEGDVTQLRIIYLESINFLKIDIQYSKEGNYWIELFQTHDIPPLPVNKETGQRYIGISALTGEITETVDVLGAETNEFHWEGKDESVEESFDFAKEMQLFLAQEYNQKIALEKDEFQKWKMLKSQPNYHTNEQKPAEIIKFSFMKTSVIFFSIITIIYLVSVYVRVSMKHFIRTKRKRAKSTGFLPT